MLRVAWRQGSFPLETWKSNRSCVITRTTTPSRRPKPWSGGNCALVGIEATGPALAADIMASLPLSLSSS